MGHNPPYYLTAYDLAVKWGFRGTEEEWLNSLTAFAMVQAAGYQGTAQDWLKDLMEPVPKLEIGGVTTLPGGSEATAELRGDRRKPMLFLGIPRGVGMADALPLVGGIMLGNINMNGYCVSGLKEPADIRDAATKEYVDKRLKKDGTEAMEADLNLDNHRVKNVANPEDGTDAANKKYVDRRLKKDGTEAMEADLNLDNHRVMNVAKPETETDAANKEYVDSKNLHMTVRAAASDWIGDAAPYTYSVNISEINSKDSPHWSAVLSDDVETALAQEEAFSLVSRLKTADGSVTFICLEEKPEVDLTIQLEVNR